MTTPVILTAALTGPIATKDDNAAPPITPKEIAASGAEAAAAGASVLHVHLRDQDGRPTADLEVARRVVAAVSERTDALIQLSTGVGLAVEFEERARLVEARPAMATLNVCSMSFGTGEFRNPPDGVRRLAARMRELGVKPELEIYDTGHLAVALRLHEEGLLEEPLQFSIVLGVRGGMPATPQDLMSLVSKMPETGVWQVVAISASNLTDDHRTRPGGQCPYRLRGHAPAPAWRAGRLQCPARHPFGSSRQCVGATDHHTERGRRNARPLIALDAGRRRERRPVAAELMAVTGSHPTFQAQPARRKQGDLLLTGRGGYLDDIDLPRMHHAAILRSTEPHARIVSIDTAAAKRMPGVRHVMTGTEALKRVGVLPHFFDPAVVGARTTEFRCLAIDRVTHEGEAVAIVVAQTLAQAEAARDAISVSYEPLPAVIDTGRALDADAPARIPRLGDQRAVRRPVHRGRPRRKIRRRAPHPGRPADDPALQHGP